MAVIIIWGASCVLGAMIGSSKGRGGAGFVLGLLLGPLGVIITLFLKENTEKVEAEALASGDSRKCPFCAELVKVEAKLCKHCGKDLPALDVLPDDAPVFGSWLCGKCRVKNDPKYGVCQSCGAEK
jgi:hypothetical protein